MRLLLDTHVWLWLFLAPEKIASPVRSLLVDPNQEVYLSAASVWEIAIKANLGKLRLPLPGAEYIPARCEAAGHRRLPIDYAHAMELFTLAPHHRDPFDRLLIAQARVEGLTLVTADSVFDRYDVAIQRADGGAAG